MFVARRRVVGRLGKTRAACLLVLGLAAWGPAGSSASPPVSPALEPPLLAATGSATNGGSTLAIGGDTAYGSFHALLFAGGTSYGALVAGFFVHSGPSGEHPTGAATFTTELNDGRTDVFNTFKGTPTCVRVVGNRAVIGLKLTGTAPPVPYITFTVEDNGPTGTDRFAWEGAGQPVSACLVPPGSSFIDLVGGDLVVHASPTRAQARLACLAERNAIGRPAFRAKYRLPGGHPWINCLNARLA